MYNLFDFIKSLTHVKIYGFIFLFSAYCFYYLISLGKIKPVFKVLSSIGFILFIVTSIILLIHGGDLDREQRGSVVYIPLKTFLAYSILVFSTIAVFIPISIQTLRIAFSNISAFSLEYAWLKSMFFAYSPLFVGVVLLFVFTFMFNPIVLIFYPRSPLRYEICNLWNEKDARFILANSGKWLINRRVCKKGNTPLHSVLERRDPDLEVISLLLKNGARRSLNKINNEGDTPIEIAFKGEGGGFNLIEGLKELGFLLPKDSKKHIAIYKNILGRRNIPIFEAFLEFNPEIDFKQTNDDGETIAHILAGNGEFTILKDIIERQKNLDLNKKDNNGKTPLDLALKNNKVSTVNFLLSKGAVSTEKIEEKGSTKDRVLHYQAKQNDEKGMLLVLQNTPKDALNKLDENRRTPLHYAVESGLGPVKPLVDAGAKIHAGLEDNGGETPLTLAESLAFKSNYYIPVLELLRKSCTVKDLEFQDKEKRAPLLMALESRHDNGIEDMLKKDIKRALYLKNEKGYTALHIISAKGNSRFTKMILDQSDKELCKAKDNQGSIPLHYAASQGTKETLKLFLEKCPKELINATDSINTTPLQFAAYIGNAENIKLLLEEGADPKVKNKNGETAIDLARKPYRNKNIEATLKAFGLE